MKTLIIGAGFTGMAAGIKTKAPIYEATDKPGGICRSYEKDGFQFFNGGPHLLFGQGVGLDYVKSIIPVNEYARNSGVYYNHIFPYPIQTTAQQQIACNEGSLKHWLLEKFGPEQCNLFFNPFNQKYTAGLYDDVIQYDEYKSPPPGVKGFAATYCDPVAGLSALVDKMAEQCTIHYNKRMVRIDTERKAIAFSDGTAERYDRLVSTIPLNQLLALCGHQLASRLIYSSVLVINIGAEKTDFTPKEHWLYVPFCKTNFHRIGFYTNIDKTRGPDGKVGLSIEMAFSHEYEYEDLDVPFIIRNVIEELQQWRFIGDVITTDPTWVKYAYTWLKAKEDRDAGIKWLKERDIISTGRYGKWHFQGMVHNIADGFEVETL